MTQANQNNRAACERFCDYRSQPGRCILANEIAESEEMYDRPGATPYDKEYALQLARELPEFCGRVVNARQIAQQLSS